MLFESLLSAFLPICRPLLSLSTTNAVMPAAETVRLSDSDTTAQPLWTSTPLNIVLSFLSGPRCPLLGSALAKTTKTPASKLLEIQHLPPSITQSLPSCTSRTHGCVHHDYQCWGKKLQGIKGMNAINQNYSIAQSGATQIPMLPPSID